MGDWTFFLSAAVAGLSIGSTVLAVCLRLKAGSDKIEQQAEITRCKAEAFRAQIEELTAHLQARGLPAPKPQPPPVKRAEGYQLGSYSWMQD